MKKSAYKIHSRKLTRSSRNKKRIHRNKNIIYYIKHFFPSKFPLTIYGFVKIFGISTVIVCLVFLFNQFKEIQHSSAAGGVPQLQHIFFIIEENHDYSQIIGSSSAPYINSLLTKGGLATGYHAAAHPSLPNYFALTAGNTLVTSDTSGPQAATNIASQLEAGGKTWKAYMESMPGNCAKSDSGGYVEHHNPFAYFSNLTSCATNDVPYTQFAADLQSGSVGNLAWIVPNVQNDMHSGTIQQADTWLSQEVPKILASSAYQQNGLLIITTDEGLKGGGTNQVFTIFLGPSVTGGFKSTTAYTHYSLLRTIGDALGVAPVGSATTATPMADFFGASSPHPTSPGVTSPATSPGASPSSPQTSGTPVTTCSSVGGTCQTAGSCNTTTQTDQGQLDCSTDNSQTCCVPQSSGVTNPPPTGPTNQPPSGSPTRPPHPSHGTPAPTQPGGGGKNGDCGDNNGDMSNIGGGVKAFNPQPNTNNPCKNKKNDTDKKNKQDNKKDENMNKNGQKTNPDIITQIFTNISSYFTNMFK